MAKFSFAHLMGLAKTTAPAAEGTSDEDNEKDEGEEGEDTEAEDGDESEKDAAVQKQVRTAVTAERTRCASIFALPEAANNVGQAAELAFNTDLTVEQAAKVLGTAPKASKDDRLSRAMANRSPQIGTDRAAETTLDPAAITSGWDRAAEQANRQLGTRRK
jgi:hypothetical protein